MGSSKMGGEWRGREPSLAMPTPSRKHLCLFSQPVGRGQQCAVSTASSWRWFLRAGGKQSAWLLGCVTEQDPMGPSQGRHPLPMSSTCFLFVEKLQPPRPSLSSSEQI